MNILDWIKNLLSVHGHLGWIPPSRRTDEMRDAHNFALAGMLPFSLVTEPPPAGTKVFLKDTWKHPQTIKSLGRYFTGNHQRTGSCVNGGAENVVQTTLLVNVLQRGLQEQIMVPFTLLAYGKSRQLAGMRGRGEGSLGSTMAKAVTQYGLLDAATTGLPSYTTTDGYDWGSEAELAWSDGTAIPQKWIDLAHQNLVAQTSAISTVDELRSAMLNGYAVTRAHMHWCNPGSEQLKGDVVIGGHDGSGGHQMSIQGYWNHPTEGELFYEQNQWGMNVYKADPTAGDGAGYWCRAATEQQAMSQQDAEHFVYSGPLGFVAQTPTWVVM